MSKLIYLESKFYGFLVAILMTGCIGQSSIDHDLDTVVSFEIGHSQSFVSAALYENSSFPCVNPVNCAPIPIRQATVSVRTNKVGGRVLDLVDLPNLGLDPFFYSDFLIALTASEQVTVQILVNQTTYSAMETMPDTSFKVNDFGYLASEDNMISPGLYIEFNEDKLAKAEAVYIQIFRDIVETPTYGFVILNDLQQASEIPNNGNLLPTSRQYYISKTELKKADPKFLISPGDNVTLVSRTLTKSSLDFFLAYRRAIINGEFSLNDGLFFAPPKNLPTNFDNGGFGMFHLYHEQKLERIAQ